MQFAKFEIRNFRGIQDLVIDLNRSPQASVFTIIGLNESGKSTILEAISHMGRMPMDLSAPDPERRPNNNVKQDQSFIPVSERYNFNGIVRLAATLKFSSNDRASIREFIANDLGMTVISIPETLTITRNIKYKDSKTEYRRSLWNIDPVVKRPKGRKTAALSEIAGKDEWLKLVKFIEANMLPHILYFKSEVFDFPNKITIWAREVDDDESERIPSEINRFYCGVIEDILHAIDPGMTIESHIVDRKNSGTDKDRQNLSALLHKVSSHVTQAVMNQWEKIFQRKLSGKRVVASCDFDEDGSIYFQLKIQDGNQLFDIADRSAGFRWFFSFIVLTQYRGKKTDSALFLYDEPASNLHSAAQKQLIDCFRSMPEHFKAIYTTHSHYLINPDWLDATFVARNHGITPDDVSQYFNSAQTDIKLIPYRKFVSENPSQVSYFQPVLDFLQYAPSRLESIKPCVLLEGKNDFYGMKYLLSICLDKELSYDLIPCGGSGTVDQLIALYSGWGKPFLVLLDSDGAGVAEKSRYIEKFGSLVEGSVLTYADIDASWSGFALEKVVGKKDLEMIQSQIYPSSKYEKKKFCLSIQELLMKKKGVELSPATKKNMNAIDDCLVSRFLV